MRISDWSSDVCSSDLITVEDGSIMGGMGSAVLEFMADKGFQANIIRLGIPDKVVEHGEQAELYEECGYDAPGIVLAVRSEERRVGKECVSTCRSGWSAYR